MGAARLGAARVFPGVCGARGRAAGAPSAKILRAAAPLLAWNIPKRRATSTPAAVPGPAEAFAPMRATQARKSSRFSSCVPVPANCSSRRITFRNASWRTSSASEGFRVSRRAPRYKMAAYGRISRASDSRSPLCASTSRPGRVMLSKLAVAVAITRKKEGRPIAKRLSRQTCRK